MSPEELLKALLMESERLLTHLNHANLGDAANAAPNSDTQGENPDEKPVENHLSNHLKKREALLTQLAELSPETRTKLRHHHGELIECVEALGEQCMAAVREASHRLMQSQQSMQQGRQALNAYQPTETHGARFIENEA